MRITDGFTGTIKSSSVAHVLKPKPTFPDGLYHFLFKTYFMEKGKSLQWHVATL